jgi:putative DNA primase/helicase
MCRAAFDYARRGWSVFPCSPVNKRPLLAREKDVDGKEIKGSGWISKATVDEDRIREWWRKHPTAMIGVPTGANGCFVLDFDPRVDPESGEVWTLDRLKGELEEQMGVALPKSVTAITQSDGVHVYFRQPEGEPIRNRGNLPAHVDVRGLGGYVIAPPSMMAETGARYRWLDRGDWRDDAAFADAPAELIAILRAPKARVAKPVGSVARARAPSAETIVDEAVRKYALAALDGECRTVREATSGSRNAALNTAALKVASLVAAGALDEGIARSSVEAAARANPGRDDEGQLLATIASGWTAGSNSPRDLGEIAAAARSRAEGRASRGGASSRPSAPRPASGDDGEPSSQSGGERRDVGRNGGVGDGEDRLTRECAFLPHTDLGNLQRFLRRYGRDFLFVEQWGWLAWDGQRWNRDMAVPLLGRAVQDTMRAIQDEAAFVKASGWKRGEAPLLEVPDERDDGLEYIAKYRGKEPVRFSTTIASWGRTSEGAGHIACTPKMAEARLAARPDEFDTDPMLLNVANGTLVFARPGGDRAASAELRPARRRDRITKIAAVAFDPAATCPRYEAFLGEVQPKADMQAFLDCWGGYNLLGLANAQKMVLNYGQGANGKSVDVDVKAHILGDYARVCGIETFIDQGKYRKGSDATPDLAALAGRRMVRASEPEEGSKFSDGLIKAMTGSEPIPVRELLKPPFEMAVTFKVTVSANNRPKIGTDHGIQRRMQLVPWDVIIPDAKQDPQLTGKLKAEGSGILNRLVRGAILYLTTGLPEPEAIREATREYQQENDLLGQFLALCIQRAPGVTMGASALHKLFAAWQTWANQLPATGKPWSPKYLNAQMQRKGFTIRKSSSMLWDDVFARFEPHEFVDGEGRAVTAELPAPRSHSASPHPSSREGDDDDMPL